MRQLFHHILIILIWLATTTTSINDDNTISYSPPTQSTPSSIKCSLNGWYNNNNNSCICNSKWSGNTCNQIQFKKNTARVIIPDNVNNVNKPWTWGGTPIYNPIDRNYHIFFSYMQNECGLLHYQTNSIVKHGVSLSPLGPWKILSRPSLEPRDGEWDSGAIHGPEIHYDRSSNVYLLFYMGTTLRDDMKRPNCIENANASIIDISKSRRIGLAYSYSIEEGKEKWYRLEHPILSPRRNARMAWDSSDVSNAAPLVFPNGSVLLAFRGGGDGVALGGGIGVAFSNHWNFSTFNRVGEGEMLFAAEDATLWRRAEEEGDGSNKDSGQFTYHMLVHRFASGNGSTAGKLVGGHAYSMNGFSNWNYDPLSWSYDTTINWINGSSTILYRRERPKILIVNNTIEYLYNGGWPCHFGPENVDWDDTKRGCQSVTIVEEV